MSSYTIGAGVTGPTGATGPTLAAALFPTAPLIDTYGRTILGDDYVTPFRDASPVTISGGQVLGSGNFTDCLDSRFSYVGGSLEQYITVATVNGSSSASEQVMFFFCDSIVAASFNGYSVEMHSNGTTAAIITKYTAGTGAAGPVCTVGQTLVSGDVCGVQIVRNGTTCVFKIYRNGTLIETVTDLTPPGAFETTTTPLFFGFEVGNNAAIRLASYGGGTSVASGVGVTGVTGVTGATGPTGTVTGPTGATGAQPGIDQVGGQNITVKASDTIMSSTTPTDIGFSFALGANGTVYVVDLWVLATSAAATTGYSVAGGPDAPVNCSSWFFIHQLAVAGTVTGGDSVATSGSTARGLSSGVPAITVTNLLRVRGIVETGNNGATLLTVRFGAEVAASVTFKAGSVMIVTRVQ